MKRGNKLPKKYWQKGKSKYLYPRAIQEKIIAEHEIGSGKPVLAMLVKKLS